MGDRSVDRSVDRRVVSKVDPTVDWKGVRLGEQKAASKAGRKDAADETVSPLEAKRVDPMAVDSVVRWAASTVKQKAAAMGGNSAAQTAAVKVGEKVAKKVAHWVALKDASTVAMTVGCWGTHSAVSTEPDSVGRSDDHSAASKAGPKAASMVARRAAWKVARSGVQQADWRVVCLAPQMAASMGFDSAGQKGDSEAVKKDAARADRMVHSMVGQRAVSRERTRVVSMELLCQHHKHRWSESQRYLK
jgi:hypothetical protein